MRFNFGGWIAPEVKRAFLFLFSCYEILSLIAQPSRSEVELKRRRCLVCEIVDR